VKDSIINDLLKSPLGFVPALSLLRAISGKAVMGDGSTEGCIPLMSHGPPSAAARVSLFDLNIEKVGCDEQAGPNLNILICVCDDDLKMCRELGALKILDLQGCEDVTDKGLSGLSALQELDLSGCKGVKDVGSAFAPSLAKLTALQALGLHSSSIGNRGVSALAPSLSKLTALQRLGLSSNSIGDQGASALAPSLARLTALTGLGLATNSIGDEGASALALSLAKLTALIGMDLDSNRISDEGDSALAELTALQSIGICSQKTELQDASYARKEGI
jgi:hypothetical protein